ncbi:HNH endonuclease signature motif containing protein [Rhodococcus opacus]|uniref:HNH endonuclease signature motif containing protein n=1 Tax=Rhodococcus opacus TaxID=37919 RepID=UPI000A5E286A|nr:HNH endonuclease signature motif containing protein [Rhodococcus opacus]
MGDNSSSAAALDATPPGIVAIEALRVGKSVLAQAQCRQVVAVTEFYDLCCDEDERRGINPAHSGSQTAVEVSVALGMNEPVVTAWIDLGLDLRHRLDGTRVAFAAGRIDLDQARVIAAMLAGVSDSKLEQLETAILDSRSLPPSKLRARARRLIARHDPDSIAHRTTLAVADRDVWIRPAENGMAYLDGHLPAADAHTLAMRLREMSIHDVCADDPRTLPQRRADALTALADSTGHLTCHCGREQCPARVATARTRRAPLIQVVVNASTLLGLDDLPAHLEGYGPICADSARTLAADGVFQRVHTLAIEGDAGGHVLEISPVQKTHGIPVTYIRNTATRPELTYAPGTALGRRIRARDGNCRFPNCQVSARLCDIDHTTPFDHEDPATGGLTVESNLACLCRRHHRLKTDGSWTVRQTGAGNVEWTTPRGDIIRTEPEGAAIELAQNHIRGVQRSRALRLLTERSHDQQDEVYLNELQGRRGRNSAPRPDVPCRPGNPELEERLPF